MTILNLAAALIAAQVAPSAVPVVSAESASRVFVPTHACAAIPRDQFRSETELRSTIETLLRYQIVHVRVDGGCYEVLAVDRKGKPYEVTFRGADLRMISRYEVKGTRQ